MPRKRKYRVYLIKQIKEYAVYVLFCPNSKNPFYVGSTKDINSRYYTHMSGRDNCTGKYIRKLLRDGMRPIIEVFFWSDDKLDALAVENKITIKYSEKYKLLNRVNFKKRKFNLDVPHFGFSPKRIDFISVSEIDPYNNNGAIDNEILSEITPVVVNKNDENKTTLDKGTIDGEISSEINPIVENKHVPDNRIKEKIDLFRRSSRPNRKISKSNNNCRVKINPKTGLRTLKRKKNWIPQEEKNKSIIAKHEKTRTIKRGSIFKIVRCNKDGYI